MAHSSQKEMQRLDKCVSHLTGLSRQMAGKLIKDGAVSVDNELITKPMTKVSINSHIVIDGYSDDLDHDDVNIADLEDDSVLGCIANDSRADSEAGAALEEAYLDSTDDDDNDADDAPLATFADDDENPLLKQRVLINTTVANAFKKRVFLMNKPCGYVCSSSDRNHALISSLWARERYSHKLQTIGRLDVDTTGLLLFTDDGELNHALTSPKKQVAKLYLARLNRSVPPQAVKQFAHGIKHPEEAKRYQSAQLTILDPNLTTTATTAKAETSTPLNQPCYWAAVQLNEGRYHEVKRLFEVVGCEVLELVRVAIGSLLLPQGLALGSYIALSEDDLKLTTINREFSAAELIELWERYQDNLQASPPRFLYYFNSQTQA